jgi:O-antigen ligase
MLDGDRVTSWPLRLLLVAWIVGLATSISLSEAALAVLTVRWVWRLRGAEARERVPWPLVPPLVAWAAVSVLSALLSGAPGASLWHTKDVFLVAALFVTADLLPDAEGADRFLSALAFALAVVSVVALVKVAACPGPTPRGGLEGWFFHRCDRARGFFHIYMTLAGVLTLVLLATLPRLLPGASRVRWLWPAWVVTLAALVATYTRGAWLAFGAGVVALLATVRRGRWLLILGLGLLAVGVLVGPQRLRQRAFSIADPSDVTVQERVYMWQSGLRMWREHPWLGVGPWGVKRLYPRYARPDALKQSTGHVHSTPLQILVERGVIGLAAWLAIWVTFYVFAVPLLAAREPERSLVAGSVAAVTGFLVGGLSEYNFGDAEVVLIAWIVMALPFVAARRGSLVHRPELSAAAAPRPRP